MPLEYGTQEDWEKHFNYLLPFFQDARYEKENNKPLFMLFKSDFSEKNAMMDYCDKRCKENGFNGICVIETIYVEDFTEGRKKASDCTQYLHCREPDVQVHIYRKAHSTVPEKAIRLFKLILRNMEVLKKPKFYDGNTLMLHKIAADRSEDDIIHGLWFEWDNTPRHKQRGYVITPYSKELFMAYMDKIKDEKYLFINAWNEWCEGMILEPTEEYGYKYLEWIKEWRDAQNSQKTDCAE